MPGKKEPIDGKMHCSKCNDWKLFTIDNFYMKADGKFMLTCKSCLILSAKQYESDKKNGVLSRSPRGGSKPVRSSNGEKRCSLCKCWKPLDYFRMTKDKRQNKVYPNNRCIDCDVQYHRQHKSPKTQETYKREYQKIKADPIKKLRNHVSKMILKALKKRGSSKNGSSIVQYLSYTINELALHLESQFEPWMTWDNHGTHNVWNDSDPSTWKWHIDHIIPQSDLPYTSMEDENFKKCWGLDNLRPLSSRQNMSDGSTRVRHNKTLVIDTSTLED